MVGSAVGGVLAQHWGVTAPFWFAFAGSALFVVLIWGQLRHVAHTDDAPEPLPEDDGPDPGARGVADPAADDAAAVEARER